MRYLFGLLAIVFFVGNASATIDQNPDQLGVYFDLNADENCLTIEPEIPFFAYVTITNPSAAQIHGWEFGYLLAIDEVFEGQIFRLSGPLPPGGTNLGNNTDLMAGEYVIGLASPLPGAGANVVVMAWQFMLLASFPVDFHLGPALIESLPDGLPAYEIGGAILPLGVSSGDVNLPVASVNGECRAVSTEGATFGRVKSLYR